MRSFDLVDFKAAEADFFLKKMAYEAVEPAIVGFYCFRFIDGDAYDVEVCDYH